MTKPQRSHNSHNQLIRNNQLNLPLFNHFNLAHPPEKRLTTVQRTKLATPQHLPGTAFVVPDAPAASSEDSGFHRLNMAIRHKEGKLVHRP